MWVLGLYVFIKGIAIYKAPKAVQGIVSSLASVSYLVYLFHRLPHKLMLNHALNVNRIVANLIHFAVVSVSSLVIAYATKWFFDWIKRILIKRNPFN